MEGRTARSSSGRSPAFTDDAEISCSVSNSTEQEACASTEGQAIFFATHLQAFYNSVLVAFIPLNTSKPPSSSRTAAPTTVGMSEEEAIQLLGIFLAFISATDQRSFRQWWLSFRSGFLAVAYPTPAGITSYSGQPSNLCSRPMSLLHALILPMLIDWIKNPSHSRTLLQITSAEASPVPENQHDKPDKPGEVDSDTAQFLADLCGQLIASLPMSETSAAIVRHAVQLYHNIVMHPLLSSWPHATRYKGDFYHKLGRLLVDKDSATSRSLARDICIDIVGNYWPSYDEKSREFFFTSLADLVDDESQYFLNYPPNVTLDEQMESLVKFAIYIMVRTEEGHAEAWQPLQHVIEQYFKIAPVHRAFITVLEDWCSLIWELCASDAFAASGGSSFINHPSGTGQTAAEPAAHEARLALRDAGIFGDLNIWRRANDSDYLNNMLLLSRRLFEMISGIRRLFNEPNTLLAFLQRLDSVLELHLKPFTVSSARYRCISHESEDGLSMVKMIYPLLVEVIQSEKGELSECRKEALQLMCRLFISSGRLLRSQSAWSAFFDTLKQALEKSELYVLCLLQTGEIFSICGQDCLVLIGPYCKAIRMFLANDETRTDMARHSIVKMLCRIVIVSLRGALPTVARGLLPAMPPLNDIQAVGEVIGMLLRLIDEERDTENKLQCISACTAALVTLLEIHCIYPHIGHNEESESNAEGNEQMQAQRLVQSLIEKLINALRGYCSFMESAEVVGLAVMSLNVLTSIYPTLMYTRDPLDYIKSIVDTLCQNLIDSRPELWKHYTLGLKEWLSLPFPFLQDESLVSSLIAALESCLLPSSMTESAAMHNLASLFSFICPMFPLTIPLSPTALLSSTSASFKPRPPALPSSSTSTASALDHVDAMLASLYYRFLQHEQSEPHVRKSRYHENATGLKPLYQDSQERCRFSEGRAESLLMNLIYAHKYKQGNYFLSYHQLVNEMEYVPPQTTLFTWGSSVFLVKGENHDNKTLFTVQVHNGTGSYIYHGKTVGQQILPNCDIDGPAIVKEKTTVSLPLPDMVAAPSQLDDSKSVSMPEVLNAPEDSKERFVRRISGLPEKDVYKVGVLYVGRGQNTQQDILANVSGSSAFRTFVSQLGSSVYLPYHTGYAGGLSKEQQLEMPFFSSPTTEIMFHVAPFFPTIIDDPQQIHKKRHIGNDELNIIWSENDVDYDEAILRTKVTMMYIILYPLAHGFVRVQLKSKRNTPFPWGPLQDGMVVPIQSLATLVRWTVINAEIELLRYLQNCCFTVPTAILGLELSSRTAPFCSAYVRRKETILESVQKWRQQSNFKAEYNVEIAILPTVEKHVVLDGLQLTNLPLSLFNAADSQLRTPISSLASSLDLHSSASFTTTAPLSSSTSSLPSSDVSSASLSLSTIPSMAERRNSKVTSLSLRFNRISSLSLSPATIFEALEELRLSHNRLTTLYRMDGLFELKHLRTLDLSHNSLSSITLLMVALTQGHLRSLERLYLHNNRIYLLPTQATMLDMSRSGETGLDSSSGPASLQLITLQNNPLFPAVTTDEDGDCSSASFSLPTLRALCWQIAMRHPSARKVGNSSLSSKCRKDAERLLEEGRSIAHKCDICCMPYIGDPVASLRRRWDGPLFGIRQTMTVGGDACSLACAGILLRHHSGDVVRLATLPSSDQERA